MPRGHISSIEPHSIADAVRMVPAARPPNVLTAAHQLQSRRSKTTAEYGRRKEIFPGVLELEHIYPTFPTGEEKKVRSTHAHV
jgi:hypothetical protein